MARAGDTCTCTNSFASILEQMRRPLSARAPLNTGVVSF